MDASLEVTLAEGVVGEKLNQGKYKPSNNKRISFPIDSDSYLSHTQQLGRRGIRKVVPPAKKNKFQI